MPTRRVLVFIAAIAVSLAAAAAPTSGVQPDRVLFGQSAKLSGGGGSQLGVQYRDGLLLAFDEANRAGGVHGRRLELVTLDDRNDEVRAAANTRELIDRHDVFALVGHTYTQPVKAALPLADKAGVPFIAPYTGFPELYDGSLRQVFTLRASFEDELATIVRHIDTIGYDRIAMAYYANPLGEELRGDVERRLQTVGRRLLATGTMPLNSADPAQAARPAAAQLAKQCPKVVILGIAGYDAAGLVRALKPACEGVRFLARGLVNTSLLMRQLGEEARGIMVTQVVPNPTRGAHPLTRGYREALKRRDAQAVPDFVEFEGYIAGRVVVQALRRSGRALDRASFVRALETEGLDGPEHYRIRFAPDRHAGGRYVNIVMISEGGRLSD